MGEILFKLLLASIMITFSVFGIYDLKNHQLKTFNLEFCLWIAFLFLSIVYFVRPILSIVS